MFTLHYYEDGQLTGSTGFICKHSRTARKEARLAADATDAAVAVMRGEKIAYIVHPGGGTGRPPASEPMSATEDCVRGVEDRACFCSPCRAARRA